MRSLLLFAVLVCGCADRSTDTCIGACDGGGDAGTDARSDAGEDAAAPRCEDCQLTLDSCVGGGSPFCWPHGFCDTCVPFCSAFGGPGPQAMCLYLAVTDLRPTPVCALPGPAEWMPVPD